MTTIKELLQHKPKSGPAVVSIAPDATLDKALQLMVQSGVHHLPVVEKEELRGIITDRDLRLAAESPWAVAAYYKGMFCNF